MPLLTTLAALGASAGAKALGSSALELGGNIGGAAYSAKQSQKMAREQMAFQERMSSTAHQREVEDLRKAGLNPILSANAGASSPGGSMGTMPDLSDLGTKVTSSARDRARVNISALQTKYNVLAMRKDMEKKGQGDGPSRCPKGHRKPGSARKKRGCVERSKYASNEAETSRIFRGRRCLRPTVQGCN